MSTTMWKKIRRKLLPRSKTYELSTTESDSNPSSEGTIERYERMCQSEIETVDRASSPEFEPVSPTKSHHSDLIDLHCEPVSPIRYSTCSGNSGESSDSECRLREPMNNTMMMAPVAEQQQQQQHLQQTQQQQQQQQQETQQQQPAEPPPKPVKKVAPPLLVPLRSKRPKSQEGGASPNPQANGETDPLKEEEEVRVPPVCPPRPVRNHRVSSRPLPPEIEDDASPPKPPAHVANKASTLPHANRIQVQVQSHPEPRPSPSPGQRSEVTVNTRPGQGSEVTVNTRPSQGSEVTVNTRPGPESEVTVNTRPGQGSEVTVNIRAEANVDQRPANNFLHRLSDPSEPVVKSHEKQKAETAASGQAQKPKEREKDQKKVNSVREQDQKKVNSVREQDQKKVNSVREQDRKKLTPVHVPLFQETNRSNNRQTNVNTVSGIQTDSGYSTLDEIVAQWESQKRAQAKQQDSCKEKVATEASKQTDSPSKRAVKQNPTAPNTDTTKLSLVENKTYDTTQKRLSNRPADSNVDVNRNFQAEETTTVDRTDRLDTRCLAGYEDLNNDATLLLDNRKTTCMPLRAKTNCNANALTNKINSKTNTRSLTDPKNGKPVRNLYTALPTGMQKSRESIKNSLDSDEDEHESLKLDEAVGPVTPEADEENNELDSGTEMGLEYYEHEEVLEETREEEDGYLPPVPSRNYHDYGQLKVEAIQKKTLKVHISQLDKLEKVSNGKEGENSLMSSDSGTEESSPSALSLSGSESKDVEPTHMSWDEVMLEAQNLGIPLVKPAVQDTPKSPSYSGRNLMTSSMTGSMTSSMMSCDTVLSLDSCRSLSSSSDYHLRLHSPNSDCTKPPSPCSSSDRSSDYLDCNRYARSLPSPGPTGDYLIPKTEKRKVPLKEKFKLQNFFHKKNKNDRIDPKTEKQKAATLHVDVQRRRLPATPRDQEDSRSIGSYGRNTPSPSLMRQLSNSSNHSLQSPSPHLSPQPHSPQLGSTPCSPHIIMSNSATVGPVPAPLPLVAPSIYHHGRHGYPSSPPVRKNTDFIGSLNQLKDCGWYWGPLNWDDAEGKLANKPDGSFLVRDSSDDRYILSLSFRSQAMTHHTRIEHYKGMFSFYSQPKSHGASTIVEFIEKAMEHSRSGKFLYFLRPRAPGLPPAPVQLLYPVSRFRNMNSLQHVCRFVILKSVRKDHIDRLPVPPKIKCYLQQSQYYTEYYGEY